MPLDLDDTITALASAPGPARRGLIRISGEQTGDVISQLFQPDEASAAWRATKIPRRFTGRLLVSSLSVPIPVALMYWPTRRSFTGQPMAEFHLIGSPPILDATLEAICHHGARLARRGEFTMRAFLSGRIDLLQAEAVLGVIEATDHEELQKALTQLGGGVTSRLSQIRHDLIAILGDLEAGLDFVEEDIEFITKDEIVRRLSEALQFIERLASESASRLPSGYRRRIVLAGLPNAGKSTLFNRMTGSQKAIVSPIAGTTRDYVTATIQLSGMDVDLIDTAGWEVAADLIMSRAQELRGEQISASDLIVWCTAADLPLEEAEADAQQLQRLRQTSASLHQIITRADLVQDQTSRNNEAPGSAEASPSHSSFSSREVLDARIDDESKSRPLRISAETGLNLQTLEGQLAVRLASSSGARSELLGTTAVRCRDSLLKSIDRIASAKDAAVTNAGDEIISLEIRHALHELGTILGEVYTDDILDHIFSNFCIGK